MHSSDQEFLVFWERWTLGKSISKVIFTILAVTHPNYPLTHICVIASYWLITNLSVASTLDPLMESPAGRSFQQYFEIYSFGSQHGMTTSSSEAKRTFVNLGLPEGPKTLWGNLEFFAQPGFNPATFCSGVSVHSSTIRTYHDHQNFITFLPISYKS